MGQLKIESSQLKIKLNLQETKLIESPLLAKVQRASKNATLEKQIQRNLVVKTAFRKNQNGMREPNKIIVYEDFWGPFSEKWPESIKKH